METPCVTYSVFIIFHNVELRPLADTFPIHTPWPGVPGPAGTASHHRDLVSVRTCVCPARPRRPPAARPGCPPAASSRGSSATIAVKCVWPVISSKAGAISLRMDPVVPTALAQACVLSALSHSTAVTRAHVDMRGLASVGAVACLGELSVAPGPRSANS